MHTTRTDVERLREDFRIEALAVIHLEKIVQKQLADELGVDQSTICRWLNYEGESDFPASLISCLFPRFPALATRMLRFNASRMGLTLVKDPANAALNGSIIDETFDAADYVGRIAAQAKKGKVDARVCADLFYKLIEAAHKGLAELKEMGDSH